MPRAASTGSSGATASSTSRSARASSTSATGEYAPIPPVLGPVSPSPTRLKSRAGARAARRVPSHSTSNEHSSPTRPSSTTTRRPASPNASPDSLAPTSASASANESVTSTPLPAARPSVFTTHGPGRERRNSIAGPASSKVPNRAVGTPASARSSFMKALEPSMRAPSAPGPNTRRPAARSRSASPSTSGASGPMTNRSASIPSGGSAVTVTVWPSGVAPAMPGLPGVTTTSAVRPSTTASACSRPPEPTTHTRATGGGPPIPVPAPWPVRSPAAVMRRR